MNPEQDQAPQNPSAPGAPEVTPPVAPPTNEPAPAPTPEPTPEPAPQAEQPAATNPFAAPSGPIGSSPSETPAAPAAPAMGSQGGGSKKKLALILGIVGGVVLLAGIAAAVYLIFFMVTKDDYKKAVDQMNVVRTEMADTSAAPTGTTAQTFDEIKADLDEYKAAHAKLGELKAFRADGELREQYEAYKQKADAFIAYTDGLMPSLEAFMSISDSLNGLTSDDLTAAKMEELVEKFKSVNADVTDPILKEFLEATINTYKEIGTQLRIYESSSASSAEKLAALNKISTEARKIGTAAAKMGEDMTAKFEELNPTDAFNDLGELTTKKYNEA